MLRAVCSPVLAECEVMEASGEVAPGALKEARKLSRFFKYEPLKFIQALHNTVLQGSGLNLDSYLPHQVLPCNLCCGV